MKKSKLSTIKEAKKISRQERKKVRKANEQPESEDVKRSPRYYGYGKLQLPTEILQELKIIKHAYEMAWADKDGKPARLTYGDLMGRLIAGAKRNDPEIVPFIESSRAGNGRKSAAGEAEKKKISKIPSDSAKALKSLKNEEIRARAEEEELDAWFAEQTKAERNDPAAILKNFRLLTDFALKDEDKKYTDLEFGSILQVGKPEKFLQLYDFEDQTVTPEEQEKAARLLATYRRRLDAELEDKIRQEKEEKERREAEERRREEERIAALKAPYRMSSADTKAYDRYKDEASQEELNKRVAAALKGLPDKEQITIDGKGLWASDGELIFSVRKDGRFKKVTNWDGAVKQPETLHYKILLK